MSLVDEYITYSPHYGGPAGRVILCCGHADTKVSTLPIWIPPRYLSLAECSEWGRPRWRSRQPGITGTGPHFGRVCSGVRPIRCKGDGHRHCEREHRSASISVGQGPQVCCGPSWRRHSSRKSQLCQPLECAQSATSLPARRTLVYEATRPLSFQGPN